MSRCMPSGCFFITKIERYIKKQSILFNISIWYYNFIKKLYEIAKERKQKWEVSSVKESRGQPKNGALKQAIEK